MGGSRDPLQAFGAYETWLARQPCRSARAGSTSGGCACFCGWLREEADERALGADPLAHLAARDYAARDFKRFLKSGRALGPASVNLALAAVDHLYRQSGSGARTYVASRCRSRGPGRCRATSSARCRVQLSGRGA